MANLFGQESLWVNLQDVPSFHDFLKPWGQGQHDVHEFLIQFLSWLAPSCMDNSWQRRVQEGEQIRTLDHEQLSIRPP